MLLITGAIAVILLIVVLASGRKPKQEEIRASSLSAGLTSSAVDLSRGRKTGSEPPDGYPYRSCGFLLSRAEAAFYRVARHALPESVLLFPKVRLIDVIKSEWRDASAKNRIIQKHLDFVIVEANSFRILGVIELDDRSHDRGDRMRRDAFVDKALASAGIPIVRIKASVGYDSDDLACKFEVLTMSRSEADLRIKTA
jgi:hypothetical protein